MIPYASFLYFGVSLYVLLPSLLIGWVKKLSRLWIVLATLASPVFDPTKNHYKRFHFGYLAGGWVCGVRVVGSDYFPGYPAARPPSPDILLCAFDRVGSPAGSQIHPSF
jgi:hypothetical protein